MKRFVNNARLNSEFKRLQRLPLLAGERGAFPAAEAVSLGTVAAADAGKELMKGRTGAEVHAIKCTHSC